MTSDPPSHQPRRGRTRGRPAQAASGKQANGAEEVPLGANSRCRVLPADVMAAHDWMPPSTPHSNYSQRGTDEGKHE